MVHAAKVDGWITALFGGLALLEVGVGVAVVGAAFIAGRPELPVSLTIASICAGAALLLGLLLCLCYSTRYEISSTDVIVRFGPFRTMLPLDAIVEVFPTRNPLSAPAPSLDRLRINYRRKNGMMWFALISPRDKLAFVRDLASATPNLQFASDEPLRLYVHESAEPVAATIQRNTPHQVT
jgi:hypothetical protein